MDGEATLVIRLYRAGDFRDCAKLFRKVMSEIYPDDETGTYAAWTFGEHTRGETIWVAEIGPHIIGLATVWPNEPFVHFLLIRPEWRRRGIGTALLNTATAEFQGTIDLKCRIENEAAQRFYETLGWREVDRELNADEPHIRYRLDDGPGA